VPATSTPGAAPSTAYTSIGTGASAGASPGGVNVDTTYTSA
jgi:hypothetical protein